MQYLKNARIQLAEANEIIEKALSTGKLSSIERDIILAKLAKAYDEILLEKKETDVPAPQPTPAPVVEKSETVYQEPPKQPEPQPTVKATAKPEPSRIVEVKPVPKKQPPTPADTQPKQAEHTSQDEGSTILADKYQGRRKFRNEIMAEHHQKMDMQTKLQNKPIHDLTKAIGINDKFLFIKELFNNDSERYNQTLKHLNQLTDLNDAIIYLQENFEWDATNEVAINFIDLVRRKFS